jgi:hypothetical protein
MKLPYVCFLALAATIISSLPAYTAGQSQSFCRVKWTFNSGCKETFLFFMTQVRWRF